MRAIWTDTSFVGWLYPTLTPNSSGSSKSGRALATRKCVRSSYSPNYSKVASLTSEQRLDEHVFVFHPWLLPSAFLVVFDQAVLEQDI